MKRPKPMEPEMFELRMSKIDASSDIDGRHADADKLMCELLESLGYGEGVKIFTAMHKWYA